MNHCLRHYEEPVAAHCRSCRHPFCSRCLVYAFGPKKPPYCVGCALHASGIRAGNRAVVMADPTEEAAPSVDKRTERANHRAEREAVKAARRVARKATSAPVEQVPDPLTTAPRAARAARVPAPSQLLARVPNAPGSF